MDTLGLFTEADLLLGTGLAGFGYPGLYQLASIRQRRLQTLVAAIRGGDTTGVNPYVVRRILGYNLF